jgi:hypothetical protein
MRSCRSRVGFGGSPKHSFLTERNKENEDCSPHETREGTRKFERQNANQNPVKRSPSKAFALFGVFGG